jgi:hypothetical protein
LEGNDDLYNLYEAKAKNFEETLKKQFNATKGLGYFRK